MTNRVIIMREATVRIVKMLAEKEVKVTQRGAKAFVEYSRTGRPVRVNVPYLPDDASEELLDAIQGFIDHEVAHILFTNYAAIAKAHKLGVAQLHNIIEDSFIERKMAGHFLGSGLNLRNVGSFFLKQYIDPQLETNPEAAEGVLFVPAVRSWGGQTTFTDYMEDKWHHMTNVTAALGDSVKEVALCSTSQDCLDLAIKFRDLLEAAKPKAPPMPPPPEGAKSESTKGESSPSVSGSDGPEPDEDDDSTPEEKPEAEAEPEEKPTDEPESEPEAEGDEEKPETEATESAPVESEPELDETEHAEDDEPAGDDAEGSGGVADEVPEGDDELDLDDMPVPSGASGETGEDPESKEDGPSMLETLESKLGKDYDEALSEVLTEKSVEDSKSADYMIYTTELDVIEPMEVGSHLGRWDDSYLKVLTDAVDHMVGPIQKDLERAMAARSRATWSAGHRSGRLHPASLSRLTMFGDDRVFRRKHVSENKDVAVELVIDCSASMTLSDKIRTASYAAYGLASVLDRMMISNEVIGFTTQDQLPHEMFEEERRLGIRYARKQTLYHPILKSFNERMTSEVKKRFAALPTVNWLNENVDGESIQIAAHRLASRRETRKIMMVLSDGNPACPGDTAQQHKHLKKSVADIERSGIDVIAIGINSSAPAKFYSKHVVLNNVADLPNTVIGQIRSLLLK